MGNKSSNPVSSFDEAATSKYSEDEVESVRAIFKSMCHPNQDSLRLENFMQISNSPVLKKRLLPRLFEVMDVKKENEIKFDSYFGTIRMLRRNNNEEISKFLLLLYGAPKSKSMRKENIGHLLLDANTAYAENDCNNFEELRRRSAGLQDLINGMVDIVFHNHAMMYTDKLTFSEFCDFVREDSNIQSLVRLLPSCLGEM